jgi:hypothetical protein
MKVNFADKTVGSFNYEFIRGVSTQAVGAAEFGECMETMHRIRKNDFDSWTREWTATADRVMTFAQSALAQRDVTAASAAFLRGSNYYRMAAFYADYRDPRHRALWVQSRTCFQQMAALSDHALEQLEVPFEEAKLPALFVSGGEGRRPTLIALGGFDSTLEEVYTWIGPAARGYGWHCLIFEGPGQWGALMDNPGLTFRGDYEKPVQAVVDYLFSRSDVDRDKIALIGYSAGGYFAPRGASGEPRIRACIPNTLVVDCAEAATAGMKGITNPWIIDAGFKFIMKISTPARWGFQHAQWTFGIGKPHEWPAAYEGYTLKGLQDQFTHPMLFLFGADDIRNASASTKSVVVGLLDFLLSLPCDRSIHMFTQQEGASSHCQMGGLSYAHTTIFTWLNHVLRGAPPPAVHESMKPEIIELFAKFGGREAGRKAAELLEQARLV